MESECPKCGDTSYETHSENERVSEGIISYQFFSQCSNCGFTTEAEP